MVSHAVSRRRLPQRRLTAYLECAGNQRVMFDLLQGRRAAGTQWGRGAVGNSEWTGVSLADVLERRTASLARLCSLSAWRHRGRGLERGGGSTWRAARLVGEQIDYGWAQFEIDWQGEVGEHAIMTRATDHAGNTQPELTPFNEKGYLFNQPLPHPISIG